MGEKSETKLERQVCQTVIDLSKAKELILDITKACGTGKGLGHRPS